MEEEGIPPMRARHNPFAVDRLSDVRYIFDSDDWAEFWNRFEGSGRRGAIVGPKGSGKTTLIEECGRKLSGRGVPALLLRFSSSDRVLGKSLAEVLFRPLSESFCLLADGVEQLSSLDRWKLRLFGRRAWGVLVTTHEAGFLPTVKTCHTTPGLLEKIVLNLVPGLSLEILADLPRLFDSSRGNIREALLALYDLFADSKCHSPIYADFTTVLPGIRQPEEGS